jgi:hypothetical protein
MLGLTEREDNVRFESQDTTLAEIVEILQIRNYEDGD